MSVAIVDYGSGNLHSAAKAFERAAREHRAAEPIVVTSDPDVVRKAERLVLPGVGGVLQVIGSVNFADNTFSGRDTRGDTTAFCNYLAGP